MVILSPGKKIKKFRTELSLNQNDLANDLVTRSLISMIENEKRNLTYDTAEIVAKNLNQFYAPLGKVITADYLLETEEEQVERYIREELKKLEPSVENNNACEDQIETSFKRIEKLAKDHKLQKVLSEVQHQMGKYHYFHYQYKEALACYNGALEYYLVDGDFAQIAKLYNEMGKCNYMLFYLETAVVYYMRAYELAIQLQDLDLRSFVAHNLILTYIKQKNYSQALQLFKEIKDNFWSSIPAVMVHNMLLIESLIYQKIGNYEKAEKVLIGLLSKKNKLSANSLALLYANLSSVYRTRKEYPKALENARQAISLQDHIDRDYMPTILFQLSEYYIAIGSFAEALTVIQEAYELSVSLELNEYIVEMCLLFCKVYMIMHEYEQAEDYLKKAESIIVEGRFQVREKIPLLYTYYIELHGATGNHAKWREYLEILRNEYEPQ